MPEVGTLLERFRAGDRLALARLLSLAARGEGVGEIAAGLGTPPRPARVVAVTGSAGVGKSTLVGKLIELLRGQRLKVAVLACDPQSPLSGGALLGDRFRMPGGPDDGVFIRSLATPGGHGAVAEHVSLMVRLVEAFGFDVVLIETVGAGQGDTTVRELADVVVLLLQPEAGDELQWEKAGVLEVADVVAVHKADLPGAEHVAAQVRSALDLTGDRTTPVVLVSARAGTGLADLWEAVESVKARRAESHDDDDLLRAAQEALAHRFAKGSPELQRIADQWRRGMLATHDAGEAALRALANIPTPVAAIVSVANAGAAVPDST